MGAETFPSATVEGLEVVSGVSIDMVLNGRANFVGLCGLRPRGSQTTVKSHRIKLGLDFLNPIVMERMTSDDPRPDLQ